MLAISTALTVISTGSTMARPLGVDVSSYQGTPNWGSAKSCGIVFGIAKATEGATINDPDFSYNMSNGKGAGVYMGTYHFAHPENNSPSTESGHFWGVAGGTILSDGKSVQPTLDFEVFSGHVGASTFSDWANQWFNDILNDAGGRPVQPVLYVSSCNACNFGSSVDAWIPWLANYNGQDPQTGSPWSACSSCNIWGGWTMWQYSSSGSVCGIGGGCDVDVYNGSLSQFQSQMIIDNPTPPPTAYSSVNGGCIAMNTDGRLEIFGVQGTTAKHEYQSGPNGSWGALSSMTGISTIPNVAIGRNSDGRLEAFAYNTANGTVYHQYQNNPGGAFTSWFQMGSSAGVTNLVVVTNTDGRMEVFGIKGGTVWHDYQSTAGGAWHGWGSHGGIVKAGYAVGRNGDGRLEIFGVGTDGAVWHDWQTTAGGSWNGWASMGGATMDGNIAVANNADGRLDMYACHSDGHVWHNYQIKGGGGAWNGWGDSGVPGTGGRGGMCIGINKDGRLEVFCSTPSGVVWHRYQNVKNGDWTPWYSLGGTSLDQHLFCANNANGALQVFGIHTGDNVIWTNYQSTPGGGWNGWFSMGNAGMMFFYGQP
jgi:GH25 family lysozyme M1 (1,4-beta-N-acetylmuramidase)